MEYAPGTSMKEMILMEMETVKAVLERSNIADEDREIVLDTLKSAYFHWAQCNAVACAFEEAVKAASPDTFMSVVKPWKLNDAITKKMAETCPNWED